MSTFFYAHALLIIIAQLWSKHTDVGRSWRAAISLYLKRREARRAVASIRHKLIDVAKQDREEADQRLPIDQPIVVSPQIVYATWADYEAAKSLPPNSLDIDDATSDDDERSRCTVTVL